MPAILGQRGQSILNVVSDLRFLLNLSSDTVETPNFGPHGLWFGVWTSFSDGLSIIEMHPTEK
jgi:hypothetical protein